MPKFVTQNINMNKYLFAALAAAGVCGVAAAAVDRPNIVLKRSMIFLMIFPRLMTCLNSCRIK